MREVELRAQLVAAYDTMRLNMPYRQRRRPFWCPASPFLFVALLHASRLMCFIGLCAGQDMHIRLEAWTSAIGGCMPRQVQDAQRGIRAARAMKLNIALRGA